MTRLDANGEPSMEEILASIRKIIAEDPPGSRPGPQPAPASSSAPEQRADVAPQGRGSYFPSLTMPQGQAPGAVASSEAPASSSGQGTAAEKTASSPTSFIPSRDASPGRIEPSFAALSRPKTSEPAQPAPTAGPAADPFSIDAQLSDLLSETDSVEADAEAPKPLDAPYSMKPTAPSGGDASSRVSSTNFSVSRDGYLPEAKAPVAGGARDPFGFNLGPSPFAAKQESEKPTPSASAFAPFPNVAAKSPVEELVAKEAETDAHAPHGRNEPPAGAPEPAVKTDDLEGAASRAAGSTPSKVEPSVSVAMAPKDEPVADKAPVVANPKPEAAPSFSGFGMPNGPVKRDVMEFASALKIPAPQAEVPSSVPSASEASLEVQDFQAGLPVTQADAQQRSMEDTVAELLRPMLRTWLAENMPRIVERALMRELDEQLPSVDRKTAAE